MSIRRLSSLMVLWLVTTLSGCSLLEVKIDSQTVPLTKQELNMRILTREYALQFFAQVEQAADVLQEQYDPNDKVNQSYVLLWKINAEEGLQAAAYQVSPMAALIDTWVFTHQMNQFYATGAGRDIFATDEAKQVSAHLANEIDQLAQSLLKKEVYDKTKLFVADFVRQYPFADLSMIRTPAYRAWLEANQISEEDAVTTLGTMPEALGDVSDRLSLVSEQTPKIMTWKAQLLALNSSASIEKVNVALNSLQVTADSMRDFIDNNPEYMRYLAEQMAVELQPLVDDIDQKTEARLSQLGEERQALEEMVARERQEIALIITHEREKFAQDMDRVSQEVVNLAMTKLIELVKSTIVYFILFIAAIFFAPLGLGYVLGKRAAVKTKVKQS
ncbi:TPA: chemotaxis protein [Vibrio parahaemolyticus]|uniref:chemotaxis protein n=1 Tax=Vibrio parahaemolyticus TaxID=670 RepID=UPI0008138D98|nr:chemotaxis protein [Vibrio parahaemolyticus]AYF20429.1 Methyl-accepting chemotaxis protein [Vibrio parahaemolyticus]EGQ9455778.1 chemotaxis protein [Vibrio parahaemolyticus]EJE4689284.1 chemotaxis protein [Vibrio parahaemolyticus]EJK2422810.1 chemotaxis protein [Vibrio parahaemolyticus]OCP68003.1 chemotaxis protein [Vibrio parahaemolyticus]